jgi:AcrR family transcriptional regulator
MPTEKRAEPKRTRDREATAQALLDAAHEEFSRKGYEGTTTKEIAARASCSEALIQRYFKSKEGLLLELIRHHKDEQAPREIGGLPEARTLVEEVKQILQLATKDICARGPILRIIVSRLMLDTKFARDFHAIAGRQRVLDAIRARLEVAAGRGWLARDADLPAAAEMLCLMRFEIAFFERVILGRREKDTDAIIENFARVFSRGIAR